MADIAAEKAGIARSGVPLITQLYPETLAARVSEVARTVGAPWLPRGGSWDAIVRQNKLHYSDEAGELELPVPRLPGRHQALNAGLAIAMLRHQQTLKVPTSALSAAMGWADWPARLQRLTAGPLTDFLPAGSELWVDGGHNPSAARLVADWVKHHWVDGRPLHMLFAALKSKDAPGILEPFAGIADVVHTLPIEGHECRDPSDLAAMDRRKLIKLITTGTIAAPVVLAGCKEEDKKEVAKEPQFHLDRNKEELAYEKSLLANGKFFTDHVRAERKVRRGPRRPAHRRLDLRPGKQPHDVAAGAHAPTLFFHNPDHLRFFTAYLN